MSRSGGVSDSMNQRAVSAPKLAMMVSGSTTFFFDFDINSTAPMVTGSPVFTWMAAPSLIATSSGNSQRPSAPL